MNKARSGLLVLLFALPLTAFAAELESLAEDCNACHGAQGISAETDIPTIAGQPAEYLTASLRGYQDWARPCIKSKYRHGDTSRPETTMCKISEALTSSEIEALGQHYAALPFVASKQAFDPALAETGGDLHEIYCESCHSMGGTAAGRGPILAGQPAPYLNSAIRQALSGEHLVPPVMEKRLADMSSNEVKQLVNFYASQQ